MARVEHDVAEAVRDQRMDHELAIVHPRLRQLQAQQLVVRERIAGAGQLFAEREVRGHRGEEVAAVEGGRDRLQAVGRVPDVHGLHDAAEPVSRGNEQAVVGPDQDPVLLGAAHGDAAPAAADPGIDHREVDAGGHEWQRAAQRQGSGADVVARDPVRDVDDPRVGGDARDDSVADADEVVGVAVVGEEGDDHGARG